MFLVPLLLLLRVVTAMREIRLNRRSSDHTADHSFAAILLVSHIPWPAAANTVSHCVSHNCTWVHPCGEGKSL